MKEKRFFKTIIAVITGVLLLSAFFILSKYYAQTKRAQYSQEIANYVDDELSFESDKRQEEIDTMTTWINNKYVSDACKGKLYERLSNIYKFENDTLTYYQYLGYALYYLNSSGETDTAANIYADLANYYISNFSFEKAQDMLDEIYQMCDVNAMEDLQVKSYVYRLQAILYEQNGQYDQALEQLVLSQKYVDMSDTDIFEKPYTAMNEIVKAKVYFDQKKYDEAQKIVDAHADSEFFSTPVYKDVLVRDFILPFYEVASKLAAHDQNEADATFYIETYCAYCEEFNYRKSEINTLLYLLEYFPSNEQVHNDIIYDKINASYLEATNMQSEEYTQLIDNQLQNSIAEQKQLRLQQKNAQKYMRRILGLLLLGFFILLTFTLILRQGRRDGLTRIHNRRALNDILWWYKLTRTNYCVIMIDIDDFKRVNDTYGHPEGDLVLKKLADILKNQKLKNALPYRYGGEEFVVLVRNGELDVVTNLAECIRKKVAETNWNFDQHITISLGVADATDGDDIIASADQNLYYSKCHGKNVVTFSSLSGKKLI